MTHDNFADLPLCSTDGAWGTELMKLGGASTELKDLWNISEPDKVLQVARAYADAGALFIGCCCGSTPAHVRPIVNAIEALQTGQ